MAMKSATISVTSRQDAYLSAESKRLDLNQAEIMRRILDAHIDRVEAETKQ